MSDDRHIPAPTTRDVMAAAATGSDSGIDVSIEEDDPVPTPKATPSKPAPSKPASTRAPDAPPSSRGETRRRSEPRIGETTKRTRAKMTLKIPDDEVSRPSHSGPPSAPASTRAPAPTPSAPPAKPEFPAPNPNLQILTPMRIITIEPPPVAIGQPSPPIPPAPIAPPQAPLRASTPPSPAPGTMSTKEDSWTPYQPTVADRAAISAAPPPVSVPRPPRPSYPSTPPGTAPLPPRAPSPSVHPAAPSVPAPTPSTTTQMAAIGESAPRLPSSDSMDEIPIVTDESPPSSGEVEIEPEEVTAERAMPGAKSLSVPAPLLVHSQSPAPLPPPSPPGAHPAVASPSVHAAVTPIATPVAIAPTPSRVSSPPVAPSPPVVPPAPVSQSQLQPSVDGTSPAMPVRAPQPPVNIKDLPPMRALAPTEPEGLEVHFEDEEPPISAARSSEPEAEIAPEDLVSVESAPSPAKAAEAFAHDTPAHAFIPPMTAAAATAVAPPSQRVSAVPTTAKLTAVTKPTPRMIVPTASPLAPPPMTDAPTGRRKARPWWEELFNDDFIRTMAKITDAQIAKEVDFVEESLAVAKGAMLLDLGCGTGRHAIELTRRGYKVVGFDLSLPMLAKAAEEAQERAQKLNFVQGDMREMTFEDTFDGIYSWNTSFGFFEEDKNQQVIQRVHKALKKGGQFVLEVGNRDFIIRQAPSLAWFEGDGCICMDEMSIDWITSRMKVKRTMMMDDGRTKEIDYSVRIYSLHELGKILHDAGFRVAEVSGRCATPGVFFGNESPKTMILAEKK
jgi:SAM-dependent methyltransferase